MCPTGLVANPYRPGSYVDWFVAGSGSDPPGVFTGYFGLGSLSLRYKTNTCNPHFYSETQRTFVWTDTFKAPDAFLRNLKWLHFFRRRKKDNQGLVFFSLRIMTWVKVIIRIRAMDHKIPKYQKNICDTYITSFPVAPPQLWIDMPLEIRSCVQWLRKKRRLNLFMGTFISN